MGASQGEPLEETVTLPVIWIPEFWYWLYWEESGSCLHGAGFGKPKFKVNRRMDAIPLRLLSFFSA